MISAIFHYGGLLLHMAMKVKGFLRNLSKFKVGELDIHNTYWKLPSDSDSLILNITLKEAESKMLSPALASE